MVDESGREFYAELPEEHWTVQCNIWVHFHVVPHLWRDHHMQPEAQLREQLTDWIGAIQDEVVIVTDCPDADFFMQLKRLLPQWPSNLNSWPMQFSPWSMGDEWQPALQKVMDDYRTSLRPKHHALHDAHALRLGWLYALKQGWYPNQVE